MACNHKGKVSSCLFKKLLTVTATLTFIAAVYMHKQYQLSNPSFRLSTSSFGTFDLIKQKVLQVCALDNSDAQNSLQKKSSKGNMRVPLMWLELAMRPKHNRQSNLYSVQQSHLACVVALYLTKKGDSDGDEMVLDGIQTNQSSLWALSKIMKTLIRTLSS